MDVRREPRWSRWALVAACALGGVLYGWALGSVGYGNSYYAAAARSMSQSWSNFFFGAFDPLGVSTVDKPPGALWVQALSVRLFGYHGWALIVPQVAEGAARGGGSSGGGLSTWGVATGTLTAQQRSVLDYATANRDGARILLATLSATGAAPYIIATGGDVIAMGGYNATDQAVSLAELERLVAEGDLRSVQLSGFTGQGAEADPRLAWIRRNCAQVRLDGVSDLYRCGA